MANINDILDEANKLAWSIKDLLKSAKIEEYEDLSGIDYNKQNPDDLQKVLELQGVLEKLEDVAGTLDYLQKPIKESGQLNRNSNDRYELNGTEYPCGSLIEYLDQDERFCSYDNDNNYVPMPYWNIGRVEHNGKGYYIVGASKDLSMDGLQVRRR